MPETDRAEAQRWHDVHIEVWRKLSEAAVTYTSQVLRMLMLLNGAAAVAMLAFLGALAPALAERLTAELPRLTEPLVWFAFGAAAPVFAAILTYFALGRRATAATARRLIQAHPYVEETASSRKSNRLAQALEIAAVLSALASLALFLGGVFAIRAAINLLGN